MPVTINGSGSITGLAVGGLPDGCVDADTLAAGAAVLALPNLLSAFWAPCKAPKIRMRYKTNNRQTMFGRLARRPKSVQ